jgi:hypothetical protein
MGQPKERSAKKNVFVEKYDEIRSFDGKFFVNTAASTDYCNPRIFYLE